MTNQDEKLNEEIIEELWNKTKKTISRWSKEDYFEALDKARQQGADNMREKLHKEGVDLCCSDCDKVKDARQQGAEAERRRIIEMIENMKVTNEYYDGGLSWNQAINTILNSETRRRTKDD